MVESEELKSLLMKVKEESENIGLRTKEPLDESERGEWKYWLKAPRSEN